MKTKIYFFIVLFMPFIIYAQWAEKKFPVNTNLIDIEFANEKVGYVITYNESLNGVVYKTTDGGTNWFYSYSGKFHPQRLQVLDINNLFFSDNTGSIYQTDDGGKTWSQLVIADVILNYYFINKTIGWVAYYSNNIFTIKRTSDAGKSWQTIVSKNSDQYLNGVKDIFFYNDSHGWILGPRFVYKTEDGGVTWNYYELWFDASYISFMNNNIGWITGKWYSSPHTVETSDGGNTWNNNNMHQVNFDTGEMETWFPLDTLFRVQAVDSNSIYLPGFSTKDDGIIFKATFPSNLFNTYWVNEPTLVYKPWLIKEHINDIEVINDNNVIAVGTNGTYLVKDTLKTISVRFPNGDEKVYPKNIMPITWNANNLLDQKIDIIFSINGGGDWINIVQNYDIINGVYNWRIPETPSNSCIIRIVQKSNNLIDVSDNNFEIVNDPRKLKLEYPLSGDTVITNSDVKIKWSKNYTSSGSLKISFNFKDQYKTEGPYYTDINAGEYIWHTPQYEKKVEITINDETNPEVVDFSSNISVNNPPYININAPSNRERWQVDSTKSISIVARYINKYSILISTDNGRNWQPFGKEEYLYDNNKWPNYVNVVVPPYLSDSCKIKVISKIPFGYSDISDSTFTITDAKSLGYFPLAIGNKWFYKHITSAGFKDVYKMLIISKDTLLENKKMYQFDEYTSNDNHFYMTKKEFNFYAQEGYYIFEYPSPQGSYPISSLKIIDLSSTYKLINLFGKTLYSFQWYGGYSPFSIYRSFVDSVGFDIYASQGRPYWNDLQELDLIGCVIDGKKYGEVFEGIPVGIKTKTNDVPCNYALSQNYPNPFNPSTTINYQIPVAGHVTIKIYDLLGREVSTLVDEYKQAGNYKTQFSTNEFNLSSGVYFYRLQSGSFLDTKKFVLMK